MGYVNVPIEIDVIATTKQTTTKRCAYFMGYTVRVVAALLALRQLSHFYDSFHWAVWWSALIVWCWLVNDAGHTCGAESILINIEIYFHLPVHLLWPRDTIWWHISRSTLAQVMACCLTAPSQYLNHCWIISSKVLRHLPEGNFRGIAPDI